MALATSRVKKPDLWTGQSARAVWLRPTFSHRASSNFYRFSVNDWLTASRLECRRLIVAVTGGD